MKLEFEAERFLGILGNREIEKSDSAGDRFRKKVVETGAEGGGEGDTTQKGSPGSREYGSRDNVTRRLLEIVWSIYPTVKYT